MAHIASDYGDIQINSVSYFRVGSRMISKGGGGGGEVDLIKLAYLLYVFGKTSLSKQCRPRSDAAFRFYTVCHSSGNFIHIHR